MSATRDIHVGTPAASYQFQLKDSVTVHFHDFENLTTVKGKPVESPKFMCAGNEWSLEICPGGDRDSTEGMVSVYLWNESSAEIDACIKISVIRNDGGVYKSHSSGDEEDIFAPGKGRGWIDFICRNQITEKTNNILLMMERSHLSSASNQTKSTTASQSNLSLSSHLEKIF